MLETRIALCSINEIRKEVGLRPIIWKKTLCLKCEKEFESKDYPRQRLCTRCRYENYVTFTLPQQELIS